MPDNVLSVGLQHWAAEATKSMSQAGFPPAQFTEFARELQPQLDSVIVPRRWGFGKSYSSTQPEGYFSRGTTKFKTKSEYSPPVPTPQDMSETEAKLRESVLPKTSKQELEEAVGKIPADPEKLKLAAFVTAALRRAVPSPTPWAVFVVAFWLTIFNGGCY